MLEGLKDSLKFSADQANDLSVAKSAPQFTKHRAFDDRVWLTHNGQMELLSIPPQRRRHTVLSLEDVAALSKLASELADGKAKPSIWIDDTRVVLLFDDLDRRDSARMELNFTRQFCALQSLAQGRKFDQPSLVHFLKFDLSGVGPELVAAVRKIQWKVNEDGFQSTEQGKSTLGRSVEAQVSGAADIPESFKLQTAVWIEQDRSYYVDVGIDVMVEQKHFRLAIMGDSLARTMAHARLDLKEELQELVDDDVAIYLGSPCCDTDRHDDVEED